MGGLWLLLWLSLAAGLTGLALLGWLGSWLGLGWLGWGGPWLVPLVAALWGLGILGLGNCLSGLTVGFFGLLAAGLLVCCWYWGCPACAWALV